jgi:MoaA/NifB/PqqE/SkfB family radical SAM enzyme
MGSPLALIKGYLEDPFLLRMYSEIRAAGPLRSILVDITHICNLRCEGCYFFAEEMDKFQTPLEESAFDEFIDREKARGTNYVSIVGGEPSLILERVKKIYDNFWMIVVTNGLQKIPYDGFEKMPIALSVWGGHGTDTLLRGEGKVDVFAKALKNYRDDPRASWYYTTTPGRAHEIEAVVEECVQNGNYIGFNFYGDIAAIGGDFDHRRGFAEVRRQIDRAIERYPDKVLSSSYVNLVVSTGTLHGEHWGYDTCCSLTFDHEKNQERLHNGKPYNPHFRAYYPDLKTTRRCCVGEARDCSNCFDVWAHISWIMLDLENHLSSKQEFTHWLTTMYLFYLANRIVDFERGIELLPEIHARTRHLRERPVEWRPPVQLPFHAAI